MRFVPDGTLAGTTMLTTLPWESGRRARIALARNGALSETMMGIRIGLGVSRLV